MPTPLTPRRWLRFSLRTFFVALTLLGIWLGFQVSAARRQKQAVDAILNAGGSVYYTYQLLPDTQFRASAHPSFSMFPCDRKASIPGPAWLRKFIGDDYFRTAVQVQIVLSDDDAARTAIGAIARLPSVQCISLIGRDARNGKIQDSFLAPIGQLDGLLRLSLRDTQVGAAFFSQLNNPASLIQLSITGLNHNIDNAALAQISKMTNLEVLSLLNCNQVTDAGLEHLSKLTKLQELGLDYFWQITDAGLKHLAGLKSLKHVLVGTTGPQVTANGIRELQEALPNAKITGPARAQ